MRSHFLNIAVIVMLSAVSCAPGRYMIDVEMRHKSKAGLDLTGKNVAVVYDGQSDGYAKSLAEGFAWTLKADYQHTIDSVGVFGLDASASRYASRDSLISLVIQTGADAVFLFDKVAVGDISNSGTDIVLPFNMSLRCYDSMNQKDEMLSFTGSNTVRSATHETVPDEFRKAGSNFAASFKPQWKHEQYSIYYFNNDAWYEALIKSEMYDWKGAMDVWFTFLSSNDALKRSCACFNIATACYMSGDYNLASEWLDKSDKDNVLPLSSVLRKRINARK